MNESFLSFVDLPRSRVVRYGAQTSSGLESMLHAMSVLPPQHTVQQGQRKIGVDGSLLLMVLPDGDAKILS